MITNTINNDKTIAGSIGTMLAGRYHILRQLGEGGMGSVWLAEDRQLDNRKVAIKMLPSIVVTDKRVYQLGTTYVLHSVTCTTGSCLKNKSSSLISKCLGGFDNE